MTAETRPGGWLRCAQPRDDALLRLVCFPHAGGSAAFFHSWARRLGPQIEVSAIQYPGRLDRLDEPAIEDVHELADQAAKAIESQIGSGRVAAFGHSMGALVAYETARRLGGTDTEMERLFVSSHPGPRRPLRGHPTTLSDETLRAELDRHGATPAALLDEVGDLILETLRSDYLAVARYRPTDGDRLHCPLVALVGHDDPDVSAAEMASWEDETTAGLTVHRFEGDHFYLLPRRREVLAVIARSSGVPW